MSYKLLFSLDIIMYGFSLYFGCGIVLLCVQLLYD